MTVRSVGVVRSRLQDLEAAPCQGDEGAPDAWLDLDPSYAPAMLGLEPGRELLVLTWLHLADRAALQVHPRGDETRPLAGVFSTRSPHRPNPIGVHPVTVAAIDGTRIRVRGMEAIDGTPVVDIKPVLGPTEGR